MFVKNDVSYSPKLLLKNEQFQNVLLSRNCNQNCNQNKLLSIREMRAAKPTNQSVRTN